MAKRRNYGERGIFAIGELAKGFGEGLKNAQTLQKQIADAELDKVRVYLEKERLRREDIRYVPDPSSPNGFRVIQSPSWKPSTGDIELFKRAGIPHDEATEPPTRTGGLRDGTTHRSARPQVKGKTPDGKPVVFNPELELLTVDGKVYEGEILPLIKKSLPAGAASDVAQIDVLETTLQQVIDNKEDKYVGILNAPRYKASAYDPTGVTTDTKAVKFYSSLQDIKNQIIYLRSGKQINEQEYKRLSAALPSEYKNPQAFDAQMENFVEVYNSIRQAKKKSFDYSGYRTAEVKDVVAGSRQEATAKKKPLSAYEGK